jgi:transaldolase/transaldolase/glucose-6-phosphate isomerase
MYVEALIGENTVNTLPIKTLKAYQDHGRPAVRLEDELEQSEAVLQQIDEQGIDMEAIAQQLEDEGLDKFIKPFDVLLETLKSKIDDAK